MYICSGSKARWLGKHTERFASRAPSQACLHRPDSSLNPQLHHEHFHSQSWSRHRSQSITDPQTVPLSRINANKDYCTALDRLRRDGIQHQRSRTPPSPPRIGTRASLFCSFRSATRACTPPESVVGDIRRRWVIRLSQRLLRVWGSIIGLE